MRSAGENLNPQGLHARTTCDERVSVLHDAQAFGQNIEESTQPLNDLYITEKAESSAGQTGKIEQTEIMEGPGSQSKGQTELTSPPQFFPEAPAKQIHEASQSRLAPTYRPPVQAPLLLPIRSRQPRARSSQNNESELHLRLRLVFDRQDGIRSLSLVPDRRPVMPAELEVTSTQGDFPLTQLQERCYQDVRLPDIGLALRHGVEWVGKGATNRRWRWVLGGRELYVLAPGGEVGLSGFVSVSRMLLGEEHVVISVMALQMEVSEALTQAGCAEREMMDETVPGVPAGWVLFRRVRPTCAVPERDQPHILNALCPKRDIEPHFVGGIRLKHRSWLLGYPPRIRLTGDTSGGVEVKIDGFPAGPAADGGFEATGWDSEGRHSLWFAGQLRRYSLQRAVENWTAWSAYNFGTAAGMCGACVHPVEQTRLRYIRVPLQNTVLVGAEPGQIIRCSPRADLRTDTCLAMVPFEPVWALPVNPTNVDKRSVHVVLIGGLEAVRRITLKTTNRANNPSVSAWSTAINNASRKRLALATDDADVIALWQSYRREAKRLSRSMRRTMR